MATADESSGLEEEMSRPTDKQLGEIFVERRNLQETDPRFVSREVLQFALDHTTEAAGLQSALSDGRIRPEMIAHLLAGRLVLRDDSATAIVTPPITVESVNTVSTSHLVEAMLRAGIWRHAKRPDSRRRDMKETEYGDLWPREVAYPAGYADRYPNLLLLDQTVLPAKLKELSAAFTDFYINPEDCQVLPKVPKFLIGRDGKRLARAIVFWGYEQNLGRKVEDCRLEISPTHTPLIGNDGMWILVEYCDSILRSHAIDLLGSSYGASSAPCVFRFDHARLHFNANHVDSRYPHCGSGFRGSELVPVP